MPVPRERRRRTDRYRKVSIGMKVLTASVILILYLTSRDDSALNLLKLFAQGLVKP